MKTIYLATLHLCALLICTCATIASTTQAPAQLLSSYYRFSLNGEVESACLELMAKASDAQKEEIALALTHWQNANKNSIKDTLVDAFGDGAKQNFESFVSEYTKAESEEDAEYLESLAGALQLSPTPATYINLRAAMSDKYMKTSINEASDLLSDIQTWLDVSAKETDTPPLAIWLIRNEPAPQPQKPARKKNSLRDNEASAPKFEASENETRNPMDAMSEMRAQKRQRKLEEAESGMQQIAAERESAEREYASRKKEAAIAESEAVKAHAQKLADVEREAIEQRQNTWGNRFKRIIGATVSAAGGAFFGGIGAEAGQRAVNAVFN